MGLILCGLTFGDKKLSTGQLMFSVVWGLVPFLNAVFILLVLFVAYKMSEEAVKK
jgi:hypothetical protein